MPKLVFTSGPLNGRSFELLVDRTSIGRSSQNTLTIPDPSVSQTHCEILVHGTEVILRDLGSSNGTSVDGELLQRAQRPLQPGARLVFGSVEARMEWDLDSSTGTTSTDVTAIHAHRRHRQQAREAGPALPPGVTEQLPPGPDSQDQTMFLPGRAKNTTSPPPSLSPLAQEPSAAPRQGTARWWIAAACLGVALVYWLFRHR